MRLLVSREAMKEARSSLNQILDDEVFKILFSRFRDRQMANGYSCRMNRAAIATDQWMPDGQRLTLLAETIRTGRWEPRHRVRRSFQIDTPGDLRRPISIGAAPAGLEIQLATCHAGIKNLSRILIFQLVKTAAPASITQRLPFG